MVEAAQKNAEDIPALAAAVRRRDRASVARAVNLAEDRREPMRARTAALTAALDTEKGALRVGVTGPPGVGKSTLVSALIRAYRGAERTVGVVAVDPSSLRSGGALLGDRARVNLDPADDGVFFRSLGSHGEHGGLTENAFSVARILSAAFDVVLIETTGVGQNETDVRDLADVVVLVVQPGSGDTLQFLKAGIMEIPDLFVVNKADEAKLAAEAVADVRRALLAERTAGVRSAAPEVLETSALHGRGTAELVAAIDRAGEADEDARRRARRRGAERWILRALERRLGSVGLERRGGEATLRASARAALEAGAAPEVALSDLLVAAAHAPSAG